MIAYKKKAFNTLMRWQTTKAYTLGEFKTLQDDPLFKKYIFNIMYLNKNWLLIQHAYFKWRAGLTQIVTKAEQESYADH